MKEYPQVLEPLLFYILHRADAIISDPKISHVFKAFFIDEAWVFLKEPPDCAPRCGGPADVGAQSGVFSEIPRLRR